MADTYEQLRRRSERRMRQRIEDAQKRVEAAKKEEAAALGEIELARQDHEKILASIESLEQSLPGGIMEPPPALRPVVPKATIPELICALLPEKNVKFTLADVVRWLEESHPDRKFNRLSLRTIVNRLMEEGAIVRLKKGGGDRRAEFVVAGSDVQLGPFGDSTTIEVAEKMIEELGQPAKINDIVDRMLSKGFEPSGTKAELKNSLTSTMQRNSRFHETEEGWTVDPKK